MSDVVNKTTAEYKRFVDTPLYSPDDWLINPDLSAVSGVPQQYWKVVDDEVVEMSDAEKNAVDVANGVSPPTAETLIQAKTRCKDQIRKHRCADGMECTDSWSDLETEFNAAAIAIANVETATIIEDAETAAAAYIGT